MLFFILFGFSHPGCMLRAKPNKEVYMLLLLHLPLLLLLPCHCQYQWGPTSPAWYHRVNRQWGLAYSAPLGFYGSRGEFCICYPVQATSHTVLRSVEDKEWGLGDGC